MVIFSPAAARASISWRTSSGVDGAANISSTVSFKTDIMSVLPPYRSAAFIHRWAVRSVNGKVCSSHCVKWP
jgi:hypothetical protein